MNSSNALGDMFSKDALSFSAAATASLMLEAIETDRDFGNGLVPLLRRDRHGQQRHRNANNTGHLHVCLCHFTGRTNDRATDLVGRCAIL